MRISKTIFCFFLALTVCAFVGCGKDSQYKKVTGTVTFNGAPLSDCFLTFFPQSPDGEGGSGKTDANGVYTVTSSSAQNGGTGLIPGEYKVVVMKNEEVIDENQAAFEKGEITYDELQQRKAKAGAYAKSAGGELITPKKFVDPALTPLTITVTTDAKANVFDFNLDE